MANRIYIIPRRNDLPGVGLNLIDLKPNAGQKNSIYDGEHQNVYVAEGLDPAGATVVDGITYISGSKATTLDGTHNDIDDDTTGGGDDCSATQATCFGLAAYLFDRVQALGAAGPGGIPLSVAEANASAVAIRALVNTGAAIDLTAINAALTVACGGDTDLDGADATSDSFGSVDDILRILSGEVYRLPLLTVLGDAAAGMGVFWPLATRQALVAAQTAAQVASQGQFYASGDFLAADDHGYQARPILVQTGAVNASLLTGVLSHYTASMNILNTNNFAYSAGTVTAWKPRAVDITGAAIAATGAGIPLFVYLNDGTVL